MSTCPPVPPAAEELAAALAALRVRAAAERPADRSPLTVWRHRRLAAIGQQPRVGGGWPLIVSKTRFDT